MKKYGQYFPCYEKMGIISRAYQKTDEFIISEITSNFLNEIKNNPDNNVKITENILDKIVILKYNPQLNSNVIC